MKKDLKKLMLNIYESRKYGEMMQLLTNTAIKFSFEYCSKNENDLNLGRFHLKYKLSELNEVSVLRFYQFRQCYLPLLVIRRYSMPPVIIFHERHSSPHFGICYNY